MKRTALVLAVALALAGCSSGGDTDKIAAAGQEASGTVEFWHFFTGRESEAIAAAVKDFQTTHPKIKVEVKDSQDDSKMVQAIAGGKGPDIGLSYSTDMVGKLCASGAWRDLSPYIARDKVDMGGYPDLVKQYTEYRGKRCAMPFLADSYGLYVNKTQFAEAGITSVPKTLAELSDAAKKLTKRSADGTIERAGFLPLFGFYENSASHWGPMVGGKWLKSDETSAIGTDPAWKELLKWQKELVDWYGYANLEKFKASLGDEFSADNAFHKGQVSMNVDGEFRAAFLKDQAPDVKFGVAPLPTLTAERHGAGYVTGNVIGVSKTAKNPEAAWELIRYLTNDTKAIVGLSNSLRNIPSTKAALAAPDLQLDAEFKVFVDMFNNPNSSTTPPTASGPAYQETFAKWLEEWQAGKATEAGLAEVDKQVNAVMKLGG
ncbi:ABC transporter substrate-binding protein [Longispora sp. NPDC051575]|uniref:ABC transporter substrate-binding protein n=1 Tax=Longispora sp. NPDC051575 TaxID=3154943 RepID=UPI003421B103